MNFFATSAGIIGARSGAFNGLPKIKTAAQAPKAHLALAVVLSAQDRSPAAPPINGT